MRIAIVHYHLQPGGVSRIIEHTVRCLASVSKTDKYRVSLVVLTGKTPPSPLPVPVRVLPGLLYEGVRDPVSPARLEQQMVDAATDALGGMPDLWHVHNHSLGKNLALPVALHGLAEKGHHLLLHIHDFAEDGRPANYHLMLDKLAGHDPAAMSRLLYPRGAHVHYGVLNRRDCTFLQEAGAYEACLWRLPNPVRLPDSLPGVRELKDPGTDDQWREEHLWLYPTRAIRRKNLGEFLLWAAVAGPNHRFATTMGPENPRERPRYEAWKRLAAELGLPVEFELSRRPGQSFEGLLSKASALVTTSVAEGFGLAFLEPWLAGRPVCGRDLPEITDEFRDEGVRLPLLYHRLGVPVEWLGRGRIRDRARAGLERSLEAYGRRPASDSLERLLEVWIQNDRVDFGRLDEEMQEIVLRRVVADPREATHLEPAFFPDPASCLEDIAHNREILGVRYSLEGYGTRLMQVYQALAGTTATELDQLDGEILLNRFLAPERLTLLRVD
ncbi:hypothetical protein [Desulfolithobacter sp.]